MEKGAIKKYAIWARCELISRVSQRAAMFGITEKEIYNVKEENIDGRILSSTEVKQRKALIDNINIRGYQEVMEEVAYTWFNRFSAMRFMEVNGYLPSHVRVFTNDENKFRPQILSEALNMDLEGIDREKIFALRNDNKDDELFKYMIILQCNDLSSILPGMFQKLEDYTELLFPDNLLRDGSVIQQMIELIPEEDWKDQVQIIGWLYQYYNSEKKDGVFASLKKKVKITKENVPAATQLFTPDWIVRYMVQNSLGDFWLEAHPSNLLREKWEFYINEFEQPIDVKMQLSDLKKKQSDINVKNIKCIDPCSGSGHILAYMFDVLMQIYEEQGYRPSDAAQSIVKNNIYGLDIDDRAAQLAYFSVMMKGRQYDNRFLRRGIQTNVYSVIDSNYVDEYVIDYIGEKNENVKTAIKTIIAEFNDAKEYGSILEISKQNWSELHARFDEISNDISIYKSAALQLYQMVKVAELMSQQYDVVVTNPPYMGLRNMSPALFDYVMNNHKDTKQDLFGVFMKICLERYCKDFGRIAMITQHVWMFTSGFEEYRRNLYNSRTIKSLVHLGTRAFEEISGEVVQTCAFIIAKEKIEGYLGVYKRLVDYENASEKEQQFFNIKNQYINTASNFIEIPGMPLCYWLSSKIIDVFNNSLLVGDVSNTKQGLKTSDDKRFVRLYFEVEATKVAKNINSLAEAANSGKKWFWLNKGGQVKWYGNNVYLINWENDGKEVKDYAIEIAGSYSKNITAIDAYFKHCISWPQISISQPSFRYMPDGYIFASAGPSLFINNEDKKWYMLGLLNSCVTQKILDAINPTINFGVSDILKVPFIYSEKYSAEINDLVIRAIELATENWNEFELSWDFKKHPFVISTNSIEDAFNYWNHKCNAQFEELKQIETRLNELYCEIYGLTGELDVFVDDNSVNIQKADKQRDIKSFISYAVGCMFGRYSLSDEGIIYAGGKWDIRRYGNFMPDSDNVIPLCDDEYFNDDILEKFVEFVKTVYGQDKLEDNLRFIANTLGGDGTSRQVIRNYFLNDFYKDHCTAYSVSGSGKRPIYWMFSSGKKGAFKCLIYMHRYQTDTIARIRTDYIHEQQSRYRTTISELEDRIVKSSTSEQVKLKKELKFIQEQSDEIHEYEEEIHHLADQMISIDLDDGVKVNYAKLETVLVKI